MRIFKIDESNDIKYKIKIVLIRLTKSTVFSVIVFFIVVYLIFKSIGNNKTEEYSNNLVKEGEIYSLDPPLPVLNITIEKKDNDLLIILLGKVYNYKLIAYFNKI